MQHNRGRHNKLPETLALTHLRNQSLHHLASLPLSCFIHSLARHAVARPLPLPLPRALLHGPLRNDALPAFGAEFEGDGFDFGSSARTIGCGVGG